MTAPEDFMCTQHNAHHLVGGIECRKAQEASLDQARLDLLREKLRGEPAEDRFLWENEGMAHRASLMSTGTEGVAVLWVARIKNMQGETVYLDPTDRRELAAALLEGLPPEEPAPRG